MLLLCVFTCAIIVGAQLDDRENQEARLHRDLLGNRSPNDKSTRPSLHSNQTTHIEFGISLIQIIELDPVTHSLHAGIWNRMVWYDYGFLWNEDDYWISVLRLPPKLIWKPDVLLLNTLESLESEIGNYQGNILVYPEGQVLWVPSSTYRISCAIDLYSFPFDTHVCTWVFRAWSNEGKDLRFDHYNRIYDVDLSDFWVNSEWDAEPAASPLVIEKDKRNHKSIAYSIRLRRRSYFYVLSLLVPIMISWLLIFILFCVPTSSNQRVFLASLNIFYLQLLTILLQWILPSNGIYAPRIVLFCGQSTIFAALSALFSVILIAMNKCESPPRLSTCLKNALIGWLGKILILDRHCIRGASLGARLLTSSNVELNVNQIDKNDYDEIREIWLLLISALNRLVFIIYFLSFIAVVITTRLSF